MKLNLPAIAASLCLALMASGPALAERAANGHGEFIVTPVSSTQYAVIFRGDTRMNQRDVAAAALHQAAQTTVSNGKEWFFVRSSASERIDASQAGALDDATRLGENTRDTSGGAGGSETGSNGGGHSATGGVDPGAVGLGTQAPSDLIRRRPPRRVYQTTLVIEVGSGDEVSITGMSQAPDIFDAAAILAGN